MQRSLLSHEWVTDSKQRSTYYEFVVIDLKKKKTSELHPYDWLFIFIKEFLHLTKNKDDDRMYVNMFKWFIYKNGTWKWPNATIVITGCMGGGHTWCLCYKNIDLFTILQYLQHIYHLDIPHLNLFHIIKIVFNVQHNHFWHFSSHFKLYTQKLHNTSC